MKYITLLLLPFLLISCAQREIQREPDVLCVQISYDGECRQFYPNQIIQE